jgi:DNA processing protein
MGLPERVRQTFREMTPEELLGPLNSVEKKNAPAVLSVAGRPEIVRGAPRVSIVGSREASEDGLRRAEKLAKILVENRVTVVSGLAKGIDAAAHRGAIAAGGETVAVLGTPLDKTYPAENASLQHRIMERHLAVSQFAVGSIVRKSNFIVRNRTMALLVNASVIVEAGETSGSLSQGWEALRLGRPLFLLKSIVDRKDLKWPKEMLAYGAEILGNENEGDLLDAIPEISEKALAAFAV